MRVSQLREQDFGLAAYLPTLAAFMSLAFYTSISGLNSTDSEAGVG